MFAWNATVQDEAGNIVPNPSITVRVKGTNALASIYESDGGPALPNPFNGDIDGFVQFWAAPGSYLVSGIAGPESTEVWEIDLGTVFATQAEVTAGTVTDKAVSPATLRSEVNSQFNSRRGRPYVILVSGQSNAANRQPFAHTIPSNLRMWSYAGSQLTPSAASTFIGTFEAASATNAYSNFGMWIGVAAARAMPNRTVYVINISRGGAAIAQWEPDAVDPKMLQALDNNVPAALTALSTESGQTVTEVDCFFWWQGESDASAGLATYANVFGSLHTRLRARSWFPWYTQITICGLTPYNPANFAAIFNDRLLETVSLDTDTRRFYNPGTIPQEFWDPADNYIHMTAAGYRLAGLAAWDAFFVGGYRKGLKFAQYSDANDAFVFGPGIPSPNFHAQFVKNFAGIARLAETNSSADPAAGASIGANNAGVGVRMEITQASGGLVASTDPRGMTYSVPNTGTHTFAGARLKVNQIPTYASDAAAGTAGLTVGELYKNADGSVRVKL